MAQLKSNLILAHGQQVQYLRVIFVAPVTGAHCDFSCVVQSLPAMCGSVLKLPTLAVCYQAYYA